MPCKTVVHPEVPARRRKRSVVLVGKRLRSVHIENKVIIALKNRARSSVTLGNESKIISST